MGMIPFSDRVAGVRVRHRQQLWTGTIRLVMPSGFLGEVEPDGVTPGRVQFFDLHEFELASDRPNLPNGTKLPDVTPADARAQRYLIDTRFFTLVNHLVAGLGAGHFTKEDVADAVLVAEVLQQQRQRRAAGDDVRGRIQTDAQEERGNDRTTE